MAVFESKTTNLMFRRKNLIKYFKIKQSRFHTKPEMEILKNAINCRDCSIMNI